jgi:hypothetical protein
MGGQGFNFDTIVSLLLLLLLPLPLSLLLEHRASVKRLLSLQFIYVRQSVGRLGRGISPSQGRYLT